ncbi:thioredoxin domain-containing protein [Micromonospora sp. NPDC048170]|uniref:DsbA family protein n=1 Tax=Micromonospora sp. NPDC048170 TaxID=3154819 RepID=UPI0033F4ECA3
MKPSTRSTPPRPGSRAGGPHALRRTAGWLGPVLVIAVVAVLIVLGRPPSDQGSTAPGGQAAGAGEERENPFAGLARRTPGDPVALGEPDAPVVIIEYSDFQCPFCRRHARQVEPRLIREYVDKGLVRIEWRDLPYLGPESRAAAAAARAAGAQGRFWEFHGALYAEERRVNSGALDDETLRAAARELGLDLGRFDADRASAVTTAAIDRDGQEATSMGITGTPAFIVGGTPIIGAQPFEAFKQTIDRELELAR